MSPSRLSSSTKNTRPCLEYSCRADPERLWPIGIFCLLLTPDCALANFSQFALAGAATNSISIRQSTISRPTEHSISWGRLQPS
jgi:hypothetical protein